MPRLELVITPALHLLLERAAALQGQTLEEFVTQVARQAAEAVVRRDNVIKLSKEAQETVANALLHPPLPNEAMKRAFLNHKKLFGN